MRHKFQVRSIFLIFIYLLGVNCDRSFIANSAVGGKTTHNSSDDQTAATSDDRNPIDQPISVSSRPDPIFVSSANLLFQSGFEDNIAVQPMKIISNVTNTYQDIVGSDASGHSWPMQLSSPTNSSLHHIINYPTNTVPDLSVYFDTHLESVTGHDGSPTKALYQSLTKRANKVTQSWYELFYSSASASPSTDLYIKYWMKFPADLKANIGSNKWRSIFFWKTVDVDYRVEAYVYTDTAGTPYWYIHGDRFKTIAGGYKEDWAASRKDIAVPVGEWFMVEIFWHRSSGSDGRIYWAVNGDVIADRYGPNYGDYNNHIDRISPFGLYGIPTAYPAFQWVDDLEVWDGFPCGDGISCFGSTPF